MANSNLYKAKNIKNDNFYTHYEDVEKELKYYREYFKNKRVYCNCDDPKESAFAKYFMDNFYELELLNLYTTKYNKDGKGILFQMSKATIGLNCETELTGNGDFRSEQCINLLMDSDVVVTNPPFSLFREFISLLIEKEKDFIIIGNQNTVTNKDMFPLIKNNKLWYGITKVKSFTQDDGTEKTFGNVCWFTNIPNIRRNEEINLKVNYEEGKYQRYDNYNAININKVSDIPSDYYGIMGVPISFLEKYNPEQFEILWQGSGNTKKCCPKDILSILGYNPIKDDKGGCPVVNGVRTYSRIFIRRLRKKNDDNIEWNDVVKWVSDASNSKPSIVSSHLVKLIYALKHKENLLINCYE